MTLRLIFSIIIFLQAFASLAQITAQQSLPQEASNATGVIDPSGGQAFENVLFRQSLDKGIQMPGHPPIDEIPAMPMPALDESARDEDFDENTGTSVMFYNAETQESLELEDTYQSRFNGQSGGGFNGVFQAEQTNADEGFANRSFFNMFTVGAATTFPRRGNVKLVMRFVDNAGNNQFFVCSGTMADAGVVLTAAHCVYSRASNIFDWAREVWVYPGWDGNGNLPPTSNENINHWGWARGTQFIAGSDYINNGNFDRDVGLIRLGDRNVGMLTGWFGWAWGFGCSTIRGRTYFNYSFPAENCPTAGLHNGRDLYYWGGSIDSCPGNQLQINTGGGNCLDTMWGGMSGSGMYYSDNGSRLVHAIASNSNRNNRGRYAKLWEQFVTDMEIFENDTRGNVFDVEALMFRTASSFVPDGGSLGASTVSISNATNNNPSSRNYTLRVYLSSNNNISSFDTLLATWNYNAVDFAAMQTRTFNVPAPTVPLGTPPGTYWVGVVLDSSADTSFFNNDTDGWDAQQITVF